MSKPNWPVLALIFVSTCAVMVVIARMGWLKGGPLPAICYDLYWPEGSNRRDWALGHNNKGTRRIPESSPVLGNADGARQSVYAEAWKAAPGLDEATLWPSVVFQVSAATINREPVWIIRATSGQWMGLWIFGGFDKAGLAATFVGHPGGNSTTPFETIFISQGREDLVLNTLRHRADRRLETYVFRPDEANAVCRGVSGP